MPVFHGEALPEWKKVVEEVHAAGGLIAPQLWHVGSARGQGADWAPLGKVDSPSGFTTPGNRKLEPMTDEDIADTIAAFGRSARATRELGFDGVEIHGAHGYLIDQFFWDGTNERDDAFGGVPVIERREPLAPRCQGDGCPRLVARRRQPGQLSEQGIPALGHGHGRLGQQVKVEAAQLALVVLTVGREQHQGSARRGDVEDE